MWRLAGRFGLSPDAFWRLSLREWRWLCHGQGDLPDRMRLAELMEACPDDRVRNGNGGGGCRADGNGGGAGTGGG
ncbi:MAG: phage tail assembly chaperone [Henriciella sp.]